MGDKLDFLVIGAQKAGTTSLWHYLRGHPSLYLAPDKEAAFFSDPFLYGKGLEWYVREYFPNPPPGALLGTITPPYMTGAENCPVETIVDRIQASTPDIRLIVILRDPIDRAISHFRMSQRRGMETRSFEEAIEALLKPVASERARAWPTETNSYLTAGEYGRILALYRRAFAPGRILVLYTQELRQKRRDVLRTLLGFLGVNDAWPGIDDGKGEYFVSGSRRRISVAAEQALYHHLITEIYPLMPEKVRDAAARSFGFFFASWNVIPDDDLPSVPDDLRRHLERYFERDAKVLDGLGYEAPWVGGFGRAVPQPVQRVGETLAGLEAERLATRVRELEIDLEATLERLEQFKPSPDGGTQA